MLNLSNAKEGDYLLTQNGEITKVYRNYGEYDMYPIEASNMRTYTYEGRIYKNEYPNELDIIATIPPQVMFEFYRILNQYHTCDSFKTILDNCYKNHIEKLDKKDI